jgi:hypothetical protein
MGLLANNSGIIKQKMTFGRGITATKPVFAGEL